MPCSLFRDLDPVRWRQLNHNPISLLSEIPLAKLENRAARTGAAQPHQLRLSPPAGISCKRTAPGAPGTPAFCGLVRWHIFPPNSALHESLPVYSGGLGVLAGDHIKSASDLGYSAGRHRLVLRPRIFPAAARSRRLAAGRISPDRRQQLPMEPAIGKNGEPVDGADRDPQRARFVPKSGA